MKQYKVIEKNATIVIPLTTTSKSVGLISSGDLNNDGEITIANNAITLDYIITDDIVELKSIFNIVDYPFLKDNVIMDIDWGDGFVEDDSYIINVDNDEITYQHQYIDTTENKNIIVRFTYDWGTISLIKKVIFTTTNVVGKVQNVSSTTSSVISSQVYGLELINDIKKLVKNTDGTYEEVIEIIEIDTCTTTDCVRDYLIQNDITGAYEQDGDIIKLIRQGIEYEYNINTQEVFFKIDYDNLYSLDVINEYNQSLTNSQIQFQEPQFFNIDYPVDIQSNIFVERDKGMPLETFYKLSEVNNILELENNGNGYFKINNISDLKI